MNRTIHFEDEQNKHHESPTVLLVEDNPLINRIYLQCLETLNCRVANATNVRQALRFCRFLSPHRFDLVFLDLELPDGEGISVSRAIRAYENIHGGHVPILMLTTLNDLKEQICRIEGCDAVFGKLPVIDFLSLAQKWLNPSAVAIS